MPLSDPDELSVPALYLIGAPAHPVELQKCNPDVDTDRRWKINDLRLLLEENAIPGKVFGLYYYKEHKD